MKIEDVNFEELAKSQEMRRQYNSEGPDRVKAQEAKVQDNRKARTHRMIVIGATLAKYVPELNEMTDDEIKIYIFNLAQKF